MAVKPARYALALVGVLICAWGAWTSGRAGLSRLLSEYGSATDSIAATEKALRYNRGDPEAHYTHAIRLAAVDRNDDALVEFERATQLRPEDYFLWQELGRARDESGDAAGAEAALGEAINFAPAYSQPHWQLGNLLLRRNELEEAFREMHQAVATDPALFSVMIDLAWGVFEGDKKGDTKSVLAMARPQDDDQRVSLATLFVKHGQIEAALNLMRAAGENVAKEDRQALVAGLIAAENFPGAYQIWLQGERRTGDIAESGGIFDGGFEGPINSSFNSQGFGWQPTQATQTVHMLVDPNEAQSGARSLRIEYAGNFAPPVAVISELVLAAPRTRYRLHFSARTEGLLSAGLPVVAVREPTGDGRVIAQSPPLPSETTGWREFSIDFETTAATSAVTINIQRQACSSNPCPIVGRAWFDDFSLKQQ